jgi:hypothetical protein
MEKRDDWIRELTLAERSELLSALDGVRHMAGDLVSITRSDFPLPELGPRLDQLRHDILDGRGFVLLRGLPIEDLSFLETATLYWGIGTYFGSARPQNARGHLLGHVVDVQGKVVEAARGYLTNRHLPYHCDYVDVVSLLCLRKARSGGLSSLVSSHTIHNEIWSRRPDLAAALYQPIPRDRHDEIPPGEGPWYELPVFNYFQGRLSVYFLRRHMEEVVKYPGVPPITAELQAAMDLVQELANDPALHLKMAFEPGDMQLIHNHQIMHDRTAYEDWPEDRKKRYLLRLWLAPHDGIALPAAFAGLYGSVTVGARGGVSVPRMAPYAPLEPV